MILKLADGRTLGVHFQHHTITHGKKTRRATTCTIHWGECTDKSKPCNAHPKLSATAECSTKDNFEKATGRKLSFTRAIRLLNRDTRREIWPLFLAFAGQENTQEAA